MAETTVHKGLAGVVVDYTTVSKVMPETNSLTYRGYPVQDLAASKSFEEVAWLLLQGELPDAAELQEFQRQERAQRSLPSQVSQLLDLLPPQAHPMDTVRTAMSLLGATDLVLRPDASKLDQALYLLAKMPAVVAADFRRRQGKAAIEPDDSLGFAENFFHMCFGQVPAREIVEAFEVSLILYAEHSFNASTFTARVVTSTMADLYSACTAAVGALKGPLHGGANEAVMEMMLEIDDPAKAAEWLRARLAAREKVMGFGHRVYKQGDSRVPTMKAALEKVAAVTGGEKWLDMYNELESVMVSDKGIHPNLDFPAGPAYYLMGFDIPMFTPIFVMSRISGWSAHILEQSANNALIRPLSEYSGVGERVVPGA